MAFPPVPTAYFEAKMMWYGIHVYDKKRVRLCVIHSEVMKTSIFDPEWISRERLVDDAKAHMPELRLSEIGEIFVVINNL